MGFLNKAKDGVNNLIGSDKIGELDGDLENKETKQEKTPKTKSPKKPKEKKKGKFFSKKKQEKELPVEPPKKEAPSIPNFLVDNDEIDPSDYITSDKVGSGRTRSMILKQLNLSNIVIPKELNISNHIGNPKFDELVTPNEIDNIEFTVTIPSGLSVDEVGRFCDKMVEQVSYYRNMLRKLNQDKEILIDEIVNMDQQVLDEKSFAQIDNMMNKDIELERLQDALINAQTENSQLKTQLNSKSKEISTNNVADKELITENEELKKEIEELNQILIDSNNYNEDINKMLSDQEENVDFLKKENKKLKEQLERQENESNQTESHNSQLKEEDTKENIVVPEEKVITKTEKVSPSKNELETEDATSYNESELLDNDDDFEKKVMANFLKTNKNNKHVKMPLTNEEILKIKEAEDNADISLKSNETMSFDEMMKDLQQ